jgi:hypothetical protein
VFGYVYASCDREVEKMAEVSAAPYRVDFSRRDIFIWAALILFFNHLVGVAKGMWSASFSELISGLCAVGAFQYMAWYAVFRLLAASNAAPTVRRKDILITAGLCALVLLPTSRMIWVAATGVAVYLMICSRDDLSMRAAGMVLAALSVQEFWGHVFFQLIDMPLLRAETAVVGTTLQLTRGGTIWHDNIITRTSGHGIVLFPYCSSFHNVSLALLCWLTLTRLRNLNWRRYDFVVGGLAAGTMILLNTTRLYLMSLDVDAYHFWHDGGGADIFKVGASVSVLLLTLYGSRPLMP